MQARCLHHPLPFTLFPPSLAGEPVEPLPLSLFSMKPITMKPATTVFLSILTITLTLWVLRGIGLLTFLPGIVIWMLLFLTIGAGVISVVSRAIRYY